MTENAPHYSVIIVGAGPGGLAVAASLKDSGIDDLIVLDKGEIGQAWLDYPAETHLLSESSDQVDDNMIAEVPFGDIFPHIPHPSHVLYQKYLQKIVTAKGIKVITHRTVTKVVYDQSIQKFTIEACSPGATHNQPDAVYTCTYLVWAAGSFYTPNEEIEGEECFIHYARIQDYSQITDTDITVVGSANGASGVVMALAKPGRMVKLVAPHEYTIPEPIDCLWKENMAFIKQLEKDDLVDIIENFRVAKAEPYQDKYRLFSTDGKEMIVPTKPILCIGFLPSVDPIKSMVEIKTEGHDWLIDVDPDHQSRHQPNLYLAGMLGRKETDKGFIRHFRDFGPIIAKAIIEKSSTK